MANLTEGYLKLIGQKIIKFKENWKDNPNKYTSFFFIITPMLDPEERKQFNYMLIDFYLKNNNISAETAEKFCYYLAQPLFMGQKLYTRQRIDGINGEFDILNKTLVNPTRLERGLRNLAFWLMIKFKDKCQESGVTFDESEYSVSDIQRGITTTL